MQQNLRPFDLVKAKNGEPVICRDGSPAKIIHFGLNDEHDFSLVVIIEENGFESVYTYTERGEFNLTCNSPLDLFMK